MTECIIVGLGGFIGTVLRYSIGLIPLKDNLHSPFKTLIINILGAFLISFIAVAAAKNKSINPKLILMLKTGLCGGFTTFSTFAYESADLIHNGHIYTAIIYIISSIILSIAAVFAAQTLAN